MRTKLATLPIFMAIALILCLCPMLAFAQEEPGSTDLVAGGIDDHASSAPDTSSETIVPAEPAAPEKAAVQAELNLLQSGSYDPAESLRLGAASNVSDVLTNDQIAVLKSRLLFGMRNLQEDIDISDLAILHSQDAVDAIMEIMSDLINTNPDLFFVSKKVVVLYYPGGACTDVQPNYSYPIASIPGMQAAYERKIQEVLSWIPSNADQETQVKAVHDWIVRNCSYNKPASEQGSSKYESANPWNAYGALVGNNPVCEGYTLAFVAVMNRLSIPSTFVSQFVTVDGKETGHSWNRVKIDGAWYNLDVTWDDNYTEMRDTDTPATTFFLKSDEWFKTTGADDDGFHTSWSPAGEPATSTKYESYPDPWQTAFDGPASNHAGAVTSVSLSASTMSLLVDTTDQLTITSVAPNTMNFTSSKASAVWTSSNPNIANVDNAGRVTAGPTAGTATITCTLGGMSRTCAVTVGYGFTLGTNEVGGRVGTCSWKIDGNGKLTISPLYNNEGRLPEWDATMYMERTDGSDVSQIDFTDAPWLDHADRIKSVAFTGTVHAPRFCGGLFIKCSNLKTADLRNFDTSATTTLEGLFYKCPALSSVNLSKLNTSNVTNMEWMFFGCRQLTSLDVSSFDTSNVTNMKYMFCCCSVNSLNLSRFNTSKVTNMRGMFSGCCSTDANPNGGLTSLNLSGFNTSNVADMSLMFEQCDGLTSLNVSMFDTRKVTNMDNMFLECHSLSSLDVSRFNTSNVTSMETMFQGCTGLASLNLSNFNTSKVTNMQGMFNCCNGLTSLNVSSFDTAKATNMLDMFRYCSNLRSLDLSSFTVTTATNTEYFIDGCSLLSRIALGKNMTKPTILPSQATVTTSEGVETRDLLWVSKVTGKAFTADEIAKTRAGIADEYTRQLAPKNSGSTDGQQGQQSSGSSANSGSSTNSGSGSASFTRLYGNVALDTMTAIVNEGWSGRTGGVVVLTTVEGYWDALTAAGIAGMAKAPVLMTDGSTISSQTASIVASLKPETIVVCGGPAAVSDTCAQEASSIAGSARIVRCAGNTATGTASDVFRKGASEGLGSWSSTAFVCTNDGYWDALAAAPISYAKAMPIFLTEGPSDISDETLAAMRDGGVQRVYIVGGPAAIGDGVIDRLNAAGIAVADRLWGNTAVETSEAVANFGLDNGMTCAKLGVATTNGYWDALAGAPLCGLNNSVLVLAGDAGSHSISGFVNSHKSAIGGSYVFGGEAALDAATYQALQDTIST